MPQGCDDSLSEASINQWLLNEYSPTAPILNPALVFSVSKACDTFTPPSTPQRICAPAATEDTNKNNVIMSLFIGLNVLVYDREAPSVVVSDTAKLLYIQEPTKKYSLKQPINPKCKLLIINAVIFHKSNTSLSGDKMH